MGIVSVIPTGDSGSIPSFLPMSCHGPKPGSLSSSTHFCPGPSLSAHNLRATLAKSNSCGTGSLPSSHLTFRLSFLFLLSLKWLCPSQCHCYILYLNLSFPLFLLSIASCPAASRFSSLLLYPDTVDHVFKRHMTPWPDSLSISVFCFIFHFHKKNIYGVCLCFYWYLIS